MRLGLDKEGRKWHEFVEVGWWEGRRRARDEALASVSLLRFPTDVVYSMGPYLPVKLNQRLRQVLPLPEPGPGSRRTAGELLQLAEERRSVCG